MHWHNSLLQICPTYLSDNISNLLSKIPAFAPLFSALAALANLLLAIYVFGYTRKKNTTDIQIKWFLELVYSPNKECFISYFKSLVSIKDKYITGTSSMTDQQKIDAMKFVKEEENKFRYEFVEILKYIAPSIYKEINLHVEKLTDTIVNALDNDELKLENQKTYTREIIGPIMESKGNIINTIFGYTGK